MNVVEVGDAAPGQCGDDVGMCAQHPVAFLEFVDGEVGLHAGDVFERFDAVVGQRHHGLIRGVVRALQADHRGAARRGGTGPPLSNACSSALPGSIISIEAIRQPSPTSHSRRKIAATALNSSLDSGSSG
jgi:hypothetical protein